LKHLEQCFERDFSGAKKWILLLLIATEEQGDDYQNPSLGEKLGQKFRLMCTLNSHSFAEAGEVHYA